MCSKRCWSVIGSQNVYKWSKFGFAVKLTQSSKSNAKLTPDLAKNGKFKLFYEGEGVCTTINPNSSLLYDDLSNDYYSNDSWYNDTFFNFD